MIQSGKRVRLAHRRWLAPICLMAVATTAAPAAAQDTVVSAGLTVRFISGSFGSDQTTRLVYAPAVLRVDAGRFEVAGYFPYAAHGGGRAPRQESTGSYTFEPCKHG